MVSRLKILITGASGLLGSKLAKIAVKNGHKVYSGYNKNRPMSGIPAKFDISDEEAVNKEFEKIKPEAVVHAAALTDVDKCEIEKKFAWSVNVKGTENIAEATKEHEAFLVYISTDYVFDGDKGMYKENDECNPINHYGLTKLEGEKRIIELMDKWCIARPSVIYGSIPAAGKVNFALWLLERLRKGERVDIVIDQWVSPTLNTSLSEMLLETLEKMLTGIFHLAGATRVSRFEMCELIAETFELDVSPIEPVRMDEIPWETNRPRDSSLDISKARNILHNKPLEINNALKEFRAELDYRRETIDREDDR